MTTETLEELRERLLRQQTVQKMIQARAYEIYQMRGGKPGGEAQDWFHAEGEVLAFLIANESAPEDQAEVESAGAAPAPNAPAEAPTVKKTKPRAPAKPVEAKAVAPTNAAAKRATARKSAGSKSKSKGKSNQSKKEKGAE